MKDISLINIIIHKFKLIIGIDLTYIIQGPISKEKALIYSIIYKIISPFSNVVISQYEDPNKHYKLTRFLAFIIKNKIDEEIHCIEINKKRINTIGGSVNLQILTTKSGLEITKTNYAVKIRSDCFFIIISILFIPHSFFRDNKILAINYSIAPKYIFKYSPHVSDWFFFGKTKDLRIGFSRYMPSYFLNIGNHINPKVASFYKQERYSDLLQAEEYLTWCFLNPKIDPLSINTFYFKDYSNNQKKINEKFLIAYGPSILLVNLFNKANYYNPLHEGRSSIRDLKSLSINSYGLYVEYLLNIIFNILKYCKITYRNTFK